MRKTVQPGDRVSGEVAGKPFTGRVATLFKRDGETVAVSVETDEALVTPAGRQVRGAILRGAEEVARLKALPSADLGRRVKTSA